MTSASTPDVVLVDTQVLSWLAKGIERGASYRRRLRGRTIAVSLFVQAELDGYEWGEKRRARLALLYAASLKLPVGASTSTWFTRVQRKRTALGMQSRVDDNDCWIIAHALEYQLPLLTHDRGMLQLAREMSVDVESELDEPVDQTNS